MGTRVRDSDLSRYFWDLRLACNVLRVDLRLHDLTWNLRLGNLQLVTCTSAHFIHRSKTRRTMNSLIDSSERLLLIMQCKIIRILSVPIQVQPWSACLVMIITHTTGWRNTELFVS